MTRYAAVSIPISTSPLRSERRVRALLQPRIEAAREDTSPPVKVEADLAPGRFKEWATRPGVRVQLDATFWSDVPSSGYCSRPTRPWTLDAEPDGWRNAVAGPKRGL